LLFPTPATFFGLEARSYAQSLFLVTLSSLLLWRWLDHAEDPPAWGDLFAGRRGYIVFKLRPAESRDGPGPGGD
jgi:hypothetical protein